jgi:hypothetical protein
MVQFSPEENLHNICAGTYHWYQSKLWEPTRSVLSTWNLDLE